MISVKTLKDQLTGDDNQCSYLSMNYIFNFLSEKVRKEDKKCNLSKIFTTKQKSSHAYLL